MRAVIIYFSNTGNTEILANDILVHISKKYETDIFEVSDFKISLIDNYDLIFLGCPASGAEELEDQIFKPFYEKIKNKLKGKKIGLFGAYDWGNGEWMEKWCSDAKNAQLNIIDFMPVNNRNLDTYNIEKYISNF